MDPDPPANIRAEHAPVAKGVLAFHVLLSAGYGTVALDAYRYFRPDSRWAKWASRTAKLALLLLVIR